MTAADYFKEKVELALDFFEARLRLIDDRYLAGVEKLALRTKDQSLAEFYRQAVRPSRIGTVVRTIRFHLDQGEIVEADMALEQLKRDVEKVQIELSRPALKAGLGKSRGGAKTAFQKHGKDVAEVHREMRQEFDVQLKRLKSKMEAEKYVARKRRVSPRTIRKARTGK